MAAAGVIKHIGLYSALPPSQRHIACLPERRDGGDQPLPDVRRMPAAGGMRERKKDTRNQKPENCQAHKRKERMERRGGGRSLSSVCQVF